MKNSDRFKPLLSVLPSKKEDSVSMKELSYKLKMSPREVRQFVLEARKNGFLILSDDRGYWESEDEKEVEDYINKRRSVAKLIFFYTQAMKKRRESHNGEN